jgi:homoserine dehydrogenase
MNLALIGFGHVGRAFARLLARQHSAFPFRIVGIHTARHGTALEPRGLSFEPVFGPPAASVEEFLDAARAEVVLELTPLNPLTGEPAISHIRAAFRRRLHVVTANKGPIAHAYAALSQEAREAGVEFRFEAAVMDGTPVFNLVRHCLPGARVLGFAGVLNSTTSVVLEALEQGHPLEEGVARARRLGIAEADASYDLEGWDAAAKTAALANVWLAAGVTPQQVDTRGIGRLTPERVQALAAKGKRIKLVSRARSTPRGIRLRVRAEVLPATDILAAPRGPTNLLLIHTDLMGAVGTFSLAPGLEQTAYGLLADLADIARSS